MTISGNTVLAAGDITNHEHGRLGTNPGLPFVICSLLIEQMKEAFGFIKRHYQIINLLAGGMLVVMGILMMMGRLFI